MWFITRSANLASQRFPLCIGWSRRGFTVRTDIGGNMSFVSFTWRLANGRGPSRVTARADSSRLSGRLKLCGLGVLERQPCWMVVSKLKDPGSGNGSGIGNGVAARLSGSGVVIGRRTGASGSGSPPGEEAPSVVADCLRPNPPPVNVNVVWSNPPRLAVRERGVRLARLVVRVRSNDRPTDSPPRAGTGDVVGRDPGWTLLERSGEGRRVLCCACSGKSPSRTKVRSSLCEASSTSFCCNGFGRWDGDGVRNVFPGDPDGPRTGLSGGDKDPPMWPIAATGRVVGPATPPGMRASKFRPLCELSDRARASAGCRSMSTRRGASSPESPGRPELGRASGGENNGPGGPRSATRRSSAWRSDGERLRPPARENGRESRGDGRRGN